MSFVSQQFLLCDNSSTANFKNWAQAISTAFSSAGWTATADTGQVNWSTVTVPAAAAFVYEIWQPADALQTGATAYYVKVKYGTNSASPAGPRLQIQIGTGTDGAGTLTGLTTTNFEPTLSTLPAGQGSIITYDCYFSGDTDRFCCMMWRSLASTVPAIFGVERTKNTDGTNSSDGVTLITVGNSNSYSGSQSTVIFGIGTGNTVTTRLVIALSNGVNGSDAFNNNIPVSPVFPVYGKYGNPMTIFGFVHTQDVAEGTQFSTTLYGATRIYIATANMQLGAPSSMKLCMRYD